jgi:hypothetical protein
MILPFVYRHLRYSSVETVQRAAWALTVHSEQNKVSQWTRSLQFIDHVDSDEENPVMRFSEYATVILVHAHVLVDLYLGHMASGGMLGITSVVASRSLSHLTVMLGPRAMALFAHIGSLCNLKSLEIISDPEYYDVNWDDCPLSRIQPWDLSALSHVSITFRSVNVFGNPVTSFVEWFCRCTMEGLADLEFNFPFTFGNDGTEDAELLGVFVSRIPGLARFCFGHDSPRAVDMLLPHAGCAILELHAHPSPQALLELRPQVRTLVIHGPEYQEGIDDEDEENIFSFLESLIAMRPPDSALACVKLGLRWPSEFRWRHDHPLVDRLGQRLIPLAIHLKKEGIALVDYYDATIDVLDLPDHNVGQIM